MEELDITQSEFDKRVIELLLEFSNKPFDYTLDITFKTGFRFSIKIRNLKPEKSREIYKQPFRVTYKVIDGCMYLKLFRYGYFQLLKFKVINVKSISFFKYTKDSFYQTGIKLKQHD